MLSFTGSLKVWVCLEVVDMRKGFEGLSALVAEHFTEPLTGGALFVFGNRRRNRLKILYFDGTGLWLMTKRLEQGTFSWPRAVEAKQAVLRLTPEALGMLTDGIDMHRATMRPWYQREQSKGK